MYRSLVGWVVVGPSGNVEVAVCRFTVHSMAQGTVGSPVNIYVEEGEVALSFSLHDELSALVDTVQVVQEVLQLVESVWPDDEGVVLVAKPAEGLVGGQQYKQKGGFLSQQVMEASHLLPQETSRT
jgi:hypothetical protein